MRVRDKTSKLAGAFTRQVLLVFQRVHAPSRGGPPPPLAGGKLFMESKQPAPHKEQVASARWPIDTAAGPTFSPDPPKKRRLHAPQSVILKVKRICKWAEDVVKEPDKKPTSPCKPPRTRSLCEQNIRILWRTSVSTHARTPPPTVRV